MFSPTSGEWKQAHSQARFVITQVMLEAGQDFLTIKEVTGEDGKPDLLITMDRSKIMSVGQPAISQFLTKLQVMFLYCQVFLSLITLKYRFTRAWETSRRPRRCMTGTPRCPGPGPPGDRS